MKAGLRGPLLLYELLYELCMSCRRWYHPFYALKPTPLTVLHTGSGISVYIVTRYYVLRYLTDMYHIMYYSLN